MNAPGLDVRLHSDAGSDRFDILERRQVASLANADLRVWVALVYTVSIGGVAGFGLWFWLIARSSMARVAPFALLMAVFAIMASVLVLGERLTPMLLTGGVIALVGVAMTQAE